MLYYWIKIGWLFTFGLMAISLFAQNEACPININFSTKDLTHWAAYTGNNANGNGPTAIMQKYDTSVAAPVGTIGNKGINEYTFSTPGIQVLTQNSTDPFGGFATIPTINGFNYGYSIMLGSTTITTGNGTGTKGGLIRGISYVINVPAGSPSAPYTMTYAYAMVLESAPHLTSQVPLFSANLNTNTGTIDCANAFYQLPTIASGTSFVLDQNAAIKEGFSLSNTLSPNDNGNINESKKRVWTKGWTEVTFDLSPYRGQKVVLTFEADNCVPGGHFAYAYIALRNTCGGLTITGDNPACTNNTSLYTIPALAGATYNWVVPNGWTILNNSNNTNILSVIVGNTPGQISVNQKNSCANLSSSINVNTSPPTIAGTITGNTTVCTGNNSSILQLNGSVGNVIKWLSSTDSINWRDIGNPNTTSYTAANLLNSTYYKAVVQNGSVCALDTSNNATIIVSEKSVGGAISPSNISICLGQNKGANLTANGFKGKIINWQSSADTLHWKNINPIYTDSVYSVLASSTPTQYRVVVQSGACPADTSKIAYTAIYDALFPQATISPTDTSICFGTKAILNLNIQAATSYTWSTKTALFDPNNNNISSNPLYLTAQAAPSKKTDYIISFKNGNCPNILTDTFRINVLPLITLNAGHDTAIIANQPLQLIATSTSQEALSYSWSPTIGLNNSSIYNPIATLNASIDSIKYKVTATNAIGCFAESFITVKIYKSNPEIFIPSAFTPNKDGLNDILKPITVGLSKLNFFRIYNRYGQLLFSTSQIGDGWDGTFNGTQQPSGAYVYVAQGIDFKGNNIFKKGTVVLIR